MKETFKKDFLVGEGGDIYISKKDSMTFHLFLILYDL
jgi:hypothetical protein